MNNNFNKLVDIIQETHITLHQSAIKAINKNLTIRNWLIGFYIVEFEQNGEDRARYGEKLLPTLAKTLNQGMFSYRNLRLFRQFYLQYPQIAKVINQQSHQLGLMGSPIWQSPIAKLLSIDSQTITINSEFDPSIIYETKYQSDAEKLINLMSYTHLVQLLSINNPAKRFFYEKECIKGNWSVSELKRQINTLYFERSGMSLEPEKLSIGVERGSEKLNVSDIIKSPFTFEFLGLKAKEVVYENDLEQALVDNLEQFLIELGHGFCFEAKQKRIVMGGEYFFVDLVLCDVAH